MPPSVGKFYSARMLERRNISDDLWAFRVDPGGEFISIRVRCQRWEL